MLKTKCWENLRPHYHKVLCVAMGKSFSHPNLTHRENMPLPTSIIYYQVFQIAVFKEAI